MQVSNTSIHHSFDRSFNKAPALDRRKGGNWIRLPGVRSGHSAYLRLPKPEAKHLVVGLRYHFRWFCF